MSKFLESVADFMCEHFTVFMGAYFVLAGGLLLSIAFFLALAIANGVSA